MRRERGQAMLETAMFIPLLLLLLVGMIELGRLTFTYFSLHKALYAAGRFLGTQPGVNFCDNEDATVIAAKNFALTGGPNNQANINGLTANMIQIRLERYDAASQELVECECSIEGCDAAAGGRGPDYIVVSIPDGYSMRPAIPFLSPTEILFRPRIRVPVGAK